jgi:hypothetical protein
MAPEDLTSSIKRKETIAPPQQKAKKQAPKKAFALGIVSKIKKKEDKEEEDKKENELKKQEEEEEKEKQEH